jgi:hypothetical protein
MDKKKSESKYRPFIKRESSLLRGQWIMDKYFGTEYQIIGINKNGVSVQKHDISYQRLLEDFLFIPSKKPVGKEV